MRAEQRQRLWWHASQSLLQAEKVANLGQRVSGPADEPPKSGTDEDTYIRDWKARAKEALKEGYQGFESGNQSLRDRASEIGRRIKEGIDSIFQASPLKAAAEKLDELRQAAVAIQGATAAGAVLVTIFLLWLAYKILWKG